MLLAVRLLNVFRVELSVRMLLLLLVLSTLLAVRLLSVARLELSVRMLLLLYMLLYFVSH